ncbi:MAG: hypothetical protein KatS3mg111_4310 [Pirellulaceae bacterium]|nr:MAG: hypothetical protein KatS3mg111_4310 [Pirellulaceae bacterium]
MRTRMSGGVGRVIRKDGPYPIRHNDSQKVIELFNCQSSLSNDRTQCSLGNFLVIGNGQTSVWWVRLPQNHVATSLSVQVIADLLKGLNRFAT